MQAYVKNTILSRAFPKVPCSYEKNISHLEFVERKDGKHLHNIPIRYVGDRKDRPTILIAHGNAEDIGQTNVIDFANGFNVNVCIFDYAGYGLHSCKSPSEAHCYADMKAVYNYLVTNKRVTPNKLIIYGRSLGSAAACHLAHYLCVSTKTPPLGLILVSPFMSAVRIVVNMNLSGDMFVNCALAPSITCPVIVLHGDKDTVVPYACGVDLAKLFPKLVKFVTLVGSDHNNIWTSAYHQEITSFISSLLQ